MSIKLMAAAWELDLPATEKMVLLCLCDHANDGGTCWPSMAGMARKCSMDQRSVRRLIRKLEARGLVQTDIARGRSSQNVYTVTLGDLKPDTQPPGHTAPPDTCAENRTPATLKPDTQPPKPSRTINEPSNNISRIEKPIGLADEVWADWKRVRKKPVTQTALTRIENEAAKIGWTLAEAIEEAAANSWTGFKADWVKEKTNAKSTSLAGPAQRALAIVRSRSHE